MFENFVRSRKYHSYYFWILFAVGLAVVAYLPTYIVNRRYTRTAAVGELSPVLHTDGLPASGFHGGNSSAHALHQLYRGSELPSYL